MMRAHGLTSDGLDERDLLAAVRRGANGQQSIRLSELLEGSPGRWAVDLFASRACTQP